MLRGGRDSNTENADSPENSRKIANAQLQAGEANSANARGADASGQGSGPGSPRSAEQASDPVEAALAKALDAAAAAGRFDVVVQLARELEARRLARAANVVDLTAHRRAR